MNPEELRNIIEAHGKWLRGEAGGVGARLDGARLDGASLVGASLDGASLVGAHGIVALPVGDPRGYRPVAVLHAHGWMISAGCRWYTVAEARAHWGAADYPQPWLGAQYIAALDWLEAWAVLGTGT